MPSGAKRRKAAKKKKEKEAHHNHNNNNSRGNDEPRSQDEREHENENNDSESSSAPPLDSEKGSVNEVSGDADEIKSTLISEENVESRDVSIEHDKSSSSSSSSSDDESRDPEKTKKKGHSSSSDTNSPRKSKAVSSFPEEGSGTPSHQEDTAHSILDTLPIFDSVEPVVEEVINVVESVPGETIVVCDVVKSSFNENKEELIANLEKDSNEGFVAVDSTIKENVEKVFPIFDTNAGESSGFTESVVKQNVDLILPSSDAPVSESSNDVESVKPTETPEHPEKEPLLGSTPAVAQRTSWLSCCGLFD